MSDFLAPVVITLLMAFLYASSKKKPQEDKDGNKVLRMPILYGIIGGISTISSIVLLIYGLLTCQPDEVIFVLFFFLLFFGLGLPLLLMSLIFKIKITPNQIEQTTMFGKLKVIKWADITTISFGSISLELKITTENQKIKAHLHLVGFPYLVKMIESKTMFECDKIGIPNH